MSDRPSQSERESGPITIYRDPADTPLTHEDGQIIADLVQTSYDRMETTMTRAEAIERMRQIAVEQQRLANELVSLYGLIEAGDSVKRLERRADERLADAKSEANGAFELAAAEAEVKRLRQGLWDCAIATGMDHDGDLTPDHLAFPDIVAVALREVRELRRDHDEALGGGLA